jgi:CheY-specific phosphatase CheX
MSTHTLNAEQLEAVRSVVMEACVEMLAACGRSVGRVEPGRTCNLSEHEIAGFIGFSGAVRGSLIVAASSKMFASTFPSIAASRPAPSRTELLDWAGELANQTLGRIKRRFCDRGVDFDTSTPTAITGRHLAARSPVREGIVEIALAVEDETVAICFEVVAPADGCIFREAAVPIPCSPEGELVLF